MPPALDLQPKTCLDGGDEWHLLGDRRARHPLIHAEALEPISLEPTPEDDRLLS